MQIISVMNQKGGVGKTNISLNIFYALGENKQVGFLDLDPQGSVTQQKPSGVPLISMRDLHSLKSYKTFDYIIIDCPPYLHDQLNEVVKLSDIVLFPTKTGIDDFNGLSNLIDHLNPEALTKSHIVFSMVQHNSSLLKQFKKPFESLGVKMFKSYISNRSEYVRTVYEGGILKSKKKADQKEFEKFIKELKSLLP